MGKNKDKKADKSLNESQTNGEAKDEVSYEDRLKFVSVISKPMASKKLAKKVSLLLNLEFSNVANLTML